MKTLQRGWTDYAIVYKSLEAQYRMDNPDINYISLPDPLSLDNVNYDYSDISLIENFDNGTGKKQYNYYLYCMV